METLGTRFSSRCSPLCFGDLVLAILVSAGDGIEPSQRSAFAHGKCVFPNAGGDPSLATANS